MKRIVLFLIFSLSHFLANVSAQVTVEARIDSLQMLVGQQTGITIDVSCDGKATVELPTFQKGQQLAPGVELVEMMAADTTKLDDGHRMQVTRKYIVTAWDSSFYYIPPMKVRVNNKEYLTKNLALKVYTLDVDTLHYDQYFGPKDVMDAPFSWDDWKPVIASLVLILLLSGLAAYLVYIRRTGKPLIRIVRRKRKEPAHKVALTAIERIKTERTWAQEDSKEYYTQLTDTLRTYIQERYGFSAMEMTSGEIIERLTQENDEEALAELRELFQTADLVKFAKWTTRINENDANLMTALEYINQTKQEEDPNQPQEEVIVTPEAKRQRITIWTMRVVSAIAAAAAFALLVWVIYRTIDLLR